MKRTTVAPAAGGQLHFFLPFTKLDDEQRQVWGRATEELIDRDGEIVTYKCAEAAFDEWNDYFQKATGGKSQGNVREMHGPVVAGHVIATIKNPDDKAVDLGLSISDDGAWKKCKAGDYIGMSIGGNPKKQHFEKRGPRNVRVIDELELIEVSLVDNPANPKALFSVVKRAKPELASEAPEVPTPEDLARAVKEAGAVPRREDVKPSEGTGEYGDVEFADDTNKKYPIDTEKHIKAAWNYINKPKNAGKYDAKALAHIKQRIVAAWKSKIDKDGPPSAKESSRLPELLKAALEKNVAGLGAPRSEYFSILPAIEALRSLCTAIDGEFCEMTFGPAGGEDERGDIATLSSAAEAVLDFIYGELQEQIRSLTGAEGEVMRSAQAALEKLLTLQKVLTPDQLKKVMSDADLNASVNAMHDMGDGIVKATHAMGVTGCKAANPHAPDPDEPDEDDGEKPDETKGAKPEHREERAAEKPVAEPGKAQPKDTPGDTGVTMPSGTSDVERPSTGQQERVKETKSAEVSEGLLKSLQEIADVLKGIPALLKSVDGRVKRIEKAPAPIGRPAAPAEKTLPGSPATDDSANEEAVHKAVVAEIRKAAEAETDPLVRERLALKAATLAVKKVHSTGPEAP